jgi:hypothetical protein
MDEEVKIASVVPPVSNKSDFSYGVGSDTLDYNVALRNKPTITAWNAFIWAGYMTGSGTFSSLITPSVVGYEGSITGKLQGQYPQILFDSYSCVFTIVFWLTCGATGGTFWCSIERVGSGTLHFRSVTLAANEDSSITINAFCANGTSSDVFYLQINPYWTSAEFNGGIWTFTVV